MPVAPTSTPLITSPTILPMQPSDTVHSLREVTGPQNSEVSQGSEVKIPHKTKTTPSDSQKAFRNPSEAATGKATNPIYPTTSPQTVKPTQPDYVINRPAEAVHPTPARMAFSNKRPHQDGIMVQEAKTQTGFSTKYVTSAVHSPTQANHSTSPIGISGTDDSPSKSWATSRGPSQTTPPSSPDSFISQIVGVTPTTSTAVTGVLPSMAVNVTADRSTDILQAHHNNKLDTLGPDGGINELQGFRILENNGSTLIGRVEVEKKEDELPEAPTTSSRLKVPLWSLKEQPSHSAVFFKKMSDTTRSKNIHYVRKKMHRTI